MPKPKIYMESTSFIDMAKEAVGNLPKGLEDDVWFAKKLLEAHRDGEVVVYTATLTVAECQHADGNYDEKVQRLFKKLLTSGQFLFLVQDSLLITERARDLRWTYDLSFHGPDGIHVASALEMGCSEFITTDNHYHSHASDLTKLHLRVIRARQTSYLPAKYRQGSLGMTLPGNAKRDPSA